MILVWVLFLWFSHFYERITPPACPLPAPWPWLKILISIIEKKKLNRNYLELNISMGTVLVIFSFFWTDNAPLTAPPPRQFVKLLISIVEKKNLNENYVEFDFSMGIALVIFSFFWTVNDLVRVPLPYVECHPFFKRHNYSHTFAYNSNTTGSIFLQFWEIATNNMTVTNLK